MEIQDFKSKETVEFIDTLSKLATLVKKTFAQRTLHLNGEKYLTNNEICEILHISQRTLKNYRDNRMLGYIQISGKILYKESDLMKLLEDNYISKSDCVSP